MLKVTKVFKVVSGEDKFTLFVGTDFSVRDFKRRICLPISKGVKMKNGKLILQLKS